MKILLIIAISCIVIGLLLAKKDLSDNFYEDKNH